MSIIRSPRPDSGFYILDRKISEDRRLSWAARGMLVFLLGKPDNWFVSIANLINETSQALGKRSGRDAVYAILDELIKVGYLVRGDQRRDAGRLSGAEYTVHETASPPCTPFPYTVNPADTVSDFPDTAKPHTANPPLPSTDVEKGLTPTEDGVKTETGDGLKAGDASADSKPSKAVSAGFARFWEAYKPAKERRTDKPRCLKLWASAGLEARTDEIVEHVQGCAASEQWKNGYAPMAATYLQQCRYDDDVPPVAANVKAATAPSYFESEQAAKTQRATQFMPSRKSAPAAAAVVPPLQTLLPGADGVLEIGGAP